MPSINDCKPRAGTGNLSVLALVYPRDLDRITSLLNTRVGNGYSKEALEERTKEAKDRYAAEIPPGFRDENETPEESREYGDIMIWSVPRNPHERPPTGGLKKRKKR